MCTQCTLQSHNKLWINLELSSQLMNSVTIQSAGQYHCHLCTCGLWGCIHNHMGLLFQLHCFYLLTQSALPCHQSPQEVEQTKWAWSSGHRADRIRGSVVPRPRFPLEGSGCMSKHLLPQLTNVLGAIARLNREQCANPWKQSNQTPSLH